MTNQWSIWQPLSFFFKKLEAALQWYSALDRELWPALLAYATFATCSKGGKVSTNHKPVAFALMRSSDPWMPRQCRQIFHMAGKSNIVADTISRPSASLLPSPSIEVRPSGAEHKPTSVKLLSGSLATVITAGGSPVTANTILGVPLGFGSITANQQGCQQTAQLATGSSQMVLSIQTDSFLFFVIVLQAGGFHHHPRPSPTMI